nr:DUF6730 family protein [uncultured Allomuricauda sp.]
MKKMDEMMELLTEEIEGFNRSIGKLEEFTKKWDNLNIRADSSNIEYHIKDFLRHQERGMEHQTKRTMETERMIKSATLVPKWLLALCCVATCATIISLSYFGYYYLRFEQSKQEAFNLGRAGAMNELWGYFEDHPVIYKDFQKWVKKKDSVSNKR